MCSWSLVTAFSGFEQTYGGLVATRLLLGACEAGVLPCLNLYVSMFWKREEIAKRGNVLFVAIALSGAFGGLFAYGLLKVDAGGYAGWRWLYFIEGAISFVWGVCLWFLFPTSPETAYFLTPEERELAVSRLNNDKALDNEKWPQIKAGLTSGICWLSGWIQCCSDVYNYSKNSHA
jgi:MFS family permease